jgi:hypothetical protein
MASLNVAGRNKLGPKFYGPFRINEKVNEVAYRLEVPPGAKLHNVFHVGLLKKFNDVALTASGWLPPIRHGRACLAMEAVTKSRLAVWHGAMLNYWSIRRVVPTPMLRGCRSRSFRACILVLSLRTSFLRRGGRDVMSGICYTRRWRTIRDAAEQKASVVAT